MTPPLAVLPVPVAAPLAQALRDFERHGATCEDFFGQSELRLGGHAFTSDGSLAALRFASHGPVVTVSWHGHTMRFVVRDSAGRCAVQVRLRASDMVRPIASAEFTIAVDAPAVDRFVAELRAMSSEVGQRAVLAGYS